jgi:rfaE bifunctional protein kinase chain/domain/rfaE bifunctional protein nucleotidyltransferase chain/domain
VSSPERKIVGLDELVGIREELRRQGKVVVHCHGCFDIVHPGHIRYLRFAREKGDCLIVTVSGDRVVGKAHDRPYISEQLRAENLAAFEFVDWVSIDHNSWAGPALEALRPDIYVKGKEYETSRDPRFARERELVESHGGAVILSSGDVIFSSTAILGRFRDRFALEGEKIRAFCCRHRLAAAELEALVRRFSDLGVLVLGDPVVDRYVHCDVVSVAEESPVLNVHELSEERYVGAAGLIARQCVMLGARATLLTALGDSGDAADFRERLGETGVDVVAVEEKKRPVYLKTRFLSDGQKVFKVNRGPYAPLSSVGSREMAAELRRLAASHHAAIASDFGYGLFSSGLVEAVSALPGQGTPYYVNVSQTSAASLLRFRGAAGATPTEGELRLAFADHESGLSNLASRFYQRTGHRRLTITLGKRGAVVFDPPPPQGGRLESEYLPACTAHPVDTVGAGDVFLATSALAELAGGTMAQSLFLAMVMAGLHVERLGNDPVDLGALLRYLKEYGELA